MLPASAFPVHQVAAIAARTYTFRGMQTAGETTLIALVSAMRSRRNTDEFERVYGLRASGPSSSAAARLTSHGAPPRLRASARYIVIDRWESPAAYDEFVAEHRRIHAPGRRDRVHYQQS